MNKPKICTVVIGETVKEFKENLELIQKKFEFIELRVDYIKDFNIELIDNIAQYVHTEAIFTCRHKDQGGKFLGSLDEQRNILRVADDLNFSYIDIDLEVYKSIGLNREKESKYIVSYHNFDKTPDYIEIIGILDEMRQTDADIYKFATLVTEKIDEQVIYKLLLSKRENENMIALGMGEKGIPTRLIGPLLGSYLTFASVGMNNSAPGQIDLKKMNEFYNNYFNIIQ